MSEALSPAKILAGALVTVLERRGALLRALLLPALLYLAFEYLRLEAQRAEREGLMAAAMLLQLMTHTIFAVTAHRILLLGDRSVPSWGLRGWGRRETLFLLQLLLVSLCLMPVVLLGAVPGVGVVLAIGVGIWLVTRLSLVFPAAAVDRPLTLTQAWRLSAPHQMPLLATVALFPVAVGLPLALLGQLVQLPVLISIAGLILTVFTLAALSLSYSEVQRLTAD